MSLLLTALGAAALCLPGISTATQPAGTGAREAETLSLSRAPEAVAGSSASVFVIDELAGHSEQELIWRGLASLYPAKVLTAPPPTFTGHSPAPPLEADLPRGVTYLRIYDPAQAVNELEAVENPQKLILDLRFCATPAPLSLLTLMEELGADQPLIVLVNARTAGQLEVQLANLQADKKILTVGTPTAGQTGTYMPIPGLDGFYVLTSELLTADGQSLLGQGLTPSVTVETDPQTDYLAYHLVERGTPVEAVLQMQLHAPPETDGEAAPAAEDTPMDAILQRGVDVIVALQVMGLLPPS